MPWPDAPATRFEAHYGDRVVRCFVERPRSIDDLLRDAARSKPAAEAVCCDSTRLTYGQLSASADRISARLHKLGIVPGDRVAILLGNRAEFAEAFFGAIRAGAIVVPLNVREQAAELAHVLVDCGAKAIVHELDLQLRLPDNSIAPDLRHRFAVGEGELSISQPYASLLEYHPESGEHQDHDEEAVAVILYTSGTTGKPKGAMLTHLSVVTSVLHFEACWGLTGADRAVMAVPASHVTGLVAILLSMVRVKGCTIFMPTFKAPEFLELACAERMSYTLIVPAMYNLCLLRADFAALDLSSWRIGGFGGAPMPEATIQALAQRAPQLQLVNAYGATESSSPASLSRPGDSGHIQTVGLPLPCTEILIVGDDGHEAPVGTPGEIWVRGAQVVRGYWGALEATKASFVGGFWRSGDIGCLDQAGYLSVLDRKKDMINRGGYKIYPAEVESVLMSHEDIAEAAVVAERDEVLGEKSRAFVFVPKGNLSSEDVRAHCRRFLSDYKAPDFVTFVDGPLPRNANGKILKRALAPQHTTQHSDSQPARG